MKLHIPRKLDKQLQKEKSLIDRLALIMGVVAPLATLPSVIAIWKGETEGVAILTWYLFVVVTVSFLAYGLLYRMKALIINEVIWLIMEAVILIGFYTHK